MKIRDTLRLSVCIAVTVGGLAAGGAAPGAGEAAIITQRQGTMTGHDDHVRAIVNFLKFDEGTAADVAKHAGGISVTARIIPTLFPEGTGMDEIKAPRTGGKPEIWLDWEGFEQAAKTLEEAAIKLMEVASGGDKVAIAAQFGAMGKNGCGGCHRNFRAKLD